MYRTTSWIALTAVGAGLIAAYIAGLLELDPIPMIVGGAVGGGVGGWIAKKQADQKRQG